MTSFSVRKIPKADTRPMLLDESDQIVERMCFQFELVSLLNMLIHLIAMVGAVRLNLVQR